MHRNGHPSILFHRGTDWGGKLRGSTNVLAERFLQAGYPVTWLSRPVNLWHLLFRRGHPGVRLFRRRYERARDGALLISPFTLLPRPRWKTLGETAWAMQARGAYQSIFPPLHSTVRLAEQPEIRVIWTCGGDGGALRRYFPAAKRIVQCVDLMEGYAGSAQNRLERSDYADADAVVAIGRALADFLVEHRGAPPSKVSVIGEGVDLGG